MRCVASLFLASCFACGLIAGCGEQADAVRAPADEGKSASAADPTAENTAGAGDPTTTNPNEPSGDSHNPPDATANSDPGEAETPPAGNEIADPLANLPAPVAASAEEQAEIGRQLAALVDAAEVPPDVPEKFRDKLSKPPVEFENGKIVYVQLAGSVRVTDEHLKLLEGLADLKSLSLSNVPHVTNRGLIHLRGLKSLEKLSLNHNRQLGDQGLACLRELANLKQLELVDLGVTDTGLAALSQLSRLETLKLQGTKITDAGLVHLQSLSSLKVLWLQFTRVSRAAAEELRDQLPNIKFIRLSDAVLKGDGA